MAAIPKPQCERDTAYLDFVRSKPCCLRGLIKHPCSSRTEAHHVSPRNGTKGTGSKVSDRRAVPVCFYGHREAERQAEKLLTFFNVTIRQLNREFDELHPRREPVRLQNKPSLKVGIGVKNCPACGGEHFYPTQDFRTVSGYRCKVKNVWIEQTATLTNEQVCEIRRSPLSPRQLAATGRYHVTANAIWAAKTGRTFKDVKCSS